MKMTTNLVILLLLCTVIGISFSQLNTPCTTPNGESSTCISVYDCQPLYESLSLETRSAEQTEFLRKSHCGSSRKPVLVCCGLLDNFYGNLLKTVTPRTECGIQEFQSRIMGGEKADLEEFPWMALLEYRNNGRSVGFQCGGVLISARYVLTAAHCVVGKIRSEVGQLFRVRLGEYDTKNKTDCTVDSGCSDEPLNINVAESIAHPDYNDSSRNRHHDIGIIRLESEAPYTSFIRPICLPSGSADKPANNVVFVSGWGQTDPKNKTYSSIKLKLRVPIVDQTKCVAQFGSANVNVIQGQLCAGGEPGKDSCRGDSGGPLMGMNSKQTDMWYLEGIVSFGAECGTGGWPGIYTRVSSYLNWILSNMGS